MISAIIVAGGRGRRFGRPKQFVEVHGRTILEHTTLKFLAVKAIGEIIIVVPQEHLAHPAVGRLVAADVRVRAVAGGDERMDSVRNGLMASHGEIVVIHDAARPFVSTELIIRCIRAIEEGSPSATVAIPARDTLKKRAKGGKFVAGIVDRSDVMQIQTPQCFRRSLLVKAYEIASDRGVSATDDATLVELTLGEKAAVVEGSFANFKITYPEDMEMAEKLLAGELRVGHGYDLHRLVRGRRFVLGGVVFDEVDFGPLGHSDGDALIHAVIDSLLAPCGLGDIGKLFPDTAPEFKDISSVELLKRVGKLLVENCCSVVNIDATVLLEKPRIGRRTPKMAEVMANALGISPELISIKGKSGEGLGDVGNLRAVEVHVVSLVRKC